VWINFKVTLKLVADQSRTPTIGDFHSDSGSQHSHTNAQGQTGGGQGGGTHRLSAASASKRPSDAAVTVGRIGSHQSVGKSGGKRSAGEEKRLRTRPVHDGDEYAETQLTTEDESKLHDAAANQDGEQEQSRRQGATGAENDCF
jgi:hypothetical protein